MRLLPILLCVFVMAGCAGKSTEPGDGRQDENVLVYRCPDGFMFTAAVRPYEAFVFLPKRTVWLTLAPSASGAKFAGEGVVYWSKGDEAMLAVPGETRQGCAVDWQATAWERAKFKGVQYRAVGNEPGWHLNIYPGERIVFVTDYGKSRHVFPLMEPEVDQERLVTVYETSNGEHRLRVVIEGSECMDDMSGEAFSTRATVTFDGRTYRGCGRGLF